MKRSLKIVLGIGLWFLLGNSMVAQDGHFSQYYASGLYLNPSLVGIEEQMVFRSNFRSQWRSVTLPYITSQVTLVYPIKENQGKPNEKLLGGVGVSFFNDKAGDGNLKTLGVYLNGAYALQFNGLGRNIVAFGFQGGMIQKQLDFTNLEWGRQYNPYLGFDPSLNPGELNVISTTTNPDFSAGFTWFNNGRTIRKKLNLYLGGAMSHFNKIDQALVGLNQYLPTLYKVHGGTEYKFSDKLKWSVSTLWMIQNKRTQLNIGSYLNYRIFDFTGDGPSDNLKLIGGVWYRVDDSYIFIIGLDNNYYSLGFSFDRNSSGLMTETRGRGAYEISLAIRQYKPKKDYEFGTPRI